MVCGEQRLVLVWVRMWVLMFEEMIFIFQCVSFGQCFSRYMVIVQVFLLEDDGMIQMCIGLLCGLCVISLGSIDCIMQLNW